MPINWKSARRICTRQELALVEASRRGTLEKLQPAQLRQKINSARRLVAKWRDAQKNQGRKARGRGTARQVKPARNAENTTRKRALFNEVLRRFEDRLRKLEYAKKPTKRKLSSVADKRSGVPKGVRRKTPKPTRGKPNEDSMVSSSQPGKRSGRATAGKKARFASAGTQRTQGHLSSRTKRSQGKRDARTARGRGR